MVQNRPADNNMPLWRKECRSPKRISHKDVTMKAGLKTLVSLTAFLLLFSKSIWCNSELFVWCIWHHFSNCNYSRDCVAVFFFYWRAQFRRNKSDRSDCEHDVDGECDRSTRHPQRTGCHFRFTANNVAFTNCRVARQVNKAPILLWVMLSIQVNSTGIWQGLNLPPSPAIFARTVPGLWQTQAPLCGRTPFKDGDWMGSRDKVRWWLADWAPPSDLCLSHNPRGRITAACCQHGASQKQGALSGNCLRCGALRIRRHVVQTIVCLLGWGRHFPPRRPAACCRPPVYPPFLMQRHWSWQTGSSFSTGNISVLARRHYGKEADYGALPVDRESALTSQNRLRSTPKTWPIWSLLYIATCTWIRAQPCRINVIVRINGTGMYAIEFDMQSPDARQIRSSSASNEIRSCSLCSYVSVADCECEQWSCCLLWPESYQQICLHFFSTESEKYLKLSAHAEVWGTFHFPYTNGLFIFSLIKRAKRKSYRKHYYSAFLILSHILKNGIYYMARPSQTEAAGGGTPSIETLSLSDGLFSS